MSEKNKLNEDWWDKNPMTYEDWDLPEDERSLKNEEKFKNINSAYMQSNPYLVDVFENFKNEGNQENVVLDIGCGWGTSTVMLSKIFKKVHSIDISTKSIGATKDNVNLNGNPERVDLSKFDAEKLNFNNFFDQIYSWGVIHHSHDTNQILSNLHKALKENGKCLIMIYYKNSLRYYLKGLYYLIFKLKIFSGHNLDSVQKFFTDGFYHTHYTKSELRKILSDIGFKNISFDVTHMEPAYLPFSKKDSFIDKFLKKNFGWLLVAKFTK
jgi:2-polyprenyl-3-methyl-5-hydroxy-6-metoxy-1,4-benzoquinol methylase